MGEMLDRLTMPPAVEVLSDKPALVQRALDLVLAQIEAAIAQRGVCTLALSGGSTPKPLYAALAQQAFPQDKLHLFWGDERYVPLDHADSNYAMVREAWLDPAQFPAANVHAVATELADPADAARQYEQEIRRFFSSPESGSPESGLPSEWPQFDIVLLGMGDDGHTASLFPKTAALDVRDRLVTLGDKDGQPRITFTAPLINRARHVLFLVAGASKRPALAQVFAEQADATEYPSRLIQPEGTCHWLLDAEAGEFQNV